VYVSAEIYPMIEIWDYPLRFASNSEEGKTLKDRARERIRQRWLAVEQAIDGEPWLVKSGFSIADLSMATVSRWTVGEKWRRMHVPKIDAIATAVSERQRAGAVWHRHFG
jgi:GST-like protein